MNELIPFKELAPGVIFYLDRYFGNAYRKVDHKTAEFTQHRLGNKYVGCQLHFSPVQAVRRTPLSPEELDLLGIDPQDEPFNRPWTPTPGMDLLGDTKPQPSGMDLL